MSVAPSDMFQYADKLADIFAEVPRLFEKNDRRIEQLDKESGDLLHAIELLDFDDEQALHYIAQLRQNRLDRRRCKDQNLVLKPLYEYIKTRPKVLTELRLCRKETEKACQLLADRSYHPRIRMELAQAFEQQAAAKGGEAHGQGPDESGSGGAGPDGDPA